MSDFITLCNHLVVVQNASRGCTRLSCIRNTIFRDPRTRGPKLVPCCVNATLGIVKTVSLQQSFVTNLQSSILNCCFIVHWGQLATSYQLNAAPGKIWFVEVVAEDVLVSRDLDSQSEGDSDKTPEVIDLTWTPVMTTLRAKSLHGVTPVMIIWQ